MNLTANALFKTISRPGELRQAPAILVSCAGLGMGNASRVVAIVEALSSLAAREGRKISFHIVSWGAGYVFLNEYKRNGGLDFELTCSHSYAGLRAGTVLNHLGTYVRNVFLLRRLLVRVSPDLIILDSDYHFPAYIGAGRPIFYIGQADDVVDRAKFNSYRPASWREVINFGFRERLDSIIQRMFASQVLVPCFTNSGVKSEKVKRIPLIVRKEFLDSTVNDTARKTVGVLLSGSEIEKSAFLSLADKHQVEVFATVPFQAEMLDRFDFVFTQGGLSSISECIARGKFVIVFPMQGHPEQALNALEVEQLGLGIRSDIGELKNYSDLIDRASRAQNMAVRKDVECNGAEVAAEAIYQKISSVEMRAQH